MSILVDALSAETPDVPKEVRTSDIVADSTLFRSVQNAIDEEGGHDKLEAQGMRAETKEQHCLMTNKKQSNGRPTSLNCYLCYLRHRKSQQGHPLKTSYGCITCSKGFHVHCYAIMQSSYLLSQTNTPSRDAMDLIDYQRQDHHLPNGRTTTSNNVAVPRDLKLP